MPEQKKRSERRVSKAEAVSMLIRVRNLLRQIKSGEWDGVSDTTRGLLDRMLVQVEALIERDRN